MNTAILFDTISIQQYVFGSNKLKDNLGASYIVEHIYDYLVRKSVYPEEEIEIGYIGGGNALLFTKSEAKAKEIIQNYTTELLWKYPGVSIAVAIKEGFDRKKYSSEIQILFGKLTENKGKFQPINTISSHGITATCQFSSLSVEVIKNYSNKTELISSFTATKRINEDEARNEEKSLLNNEIFDELKFPDKLEDLGQRKGEDSHIAIVHIDGNGFGNIFRELNSIEETSNLSSKVKTVVREAFIHILSEYVVNKDTIKYLFEEYFIKGYILPIRPIILGGDDITFVCHGKLGIWFAEQFMENFNNNNFIGHDRKEQKFSSCAGIAIVKTKYPFYRAYQLAEELCTSAKNARKKYMDTQQTENGGNWIDFQLAYSGLGNTLEEVRKLQFFNIKGNKPLYNRPYRLEKVAGNISFDQLKKYSLTLKETLPNAKIKDLREMLTRDDASFEDFMEHLKHQHNEFKMKFFNRQNDQKNKYPFFDMIELLEIYPTNLINKK